MTQEELQNLAIQEADKILTSQGLPTYTQLEERLFMALTANVNALAVRLHGRLLRSQREYQIP